MDSNAGGDLGPDEFDLFIRQDSFEAHDTPQEEFNQFLGEDWDMHMDFLNQQYEAMSPEEQQGIFDSAASPQTSSSSVNQQYKDISRHQYQNSDNAAKPRTPASTGKDRIPRNGSCGQGYYNEESSRSISYQSQTHAQTYGQSYRPHGDNGGSQAPQARKSQLSAEGGRPILSTHSTVNLSQIEFSVTNSQGDMRPPPLPAQKLGTHLHANRGFNIQQQAVTYNQSFSQPANSSQSSPNYPVAAPSRSFRFNLFRYPESREAANEFLKCPIEGIFSDLSYHLVNWNAHDRKLERPNNLQDLAISYYNYVSLEIQPKSTALIFLITTMHQSFHTAVHQWLFDCYLLAIKIQTSCPLSSQIIKSCNNIKQEIARLVGNVLVTDMKTHSAQSNEGSGIKPPSVFGKDIVPQVWTGQWADGGNGLNILGVPPRVEFHAQWSRYFLEKATKKLMDDGIDPRDNQLEKLLVIDLEAENAEGLI